MTERGHDGPERLLVFVNHAGDAPPPREAMDVVVLDTSWTPPPGARADVLPLRPVIWSIISERNVYDESLAALDDWAQRAGLIKRLTVGGTSWWYHMRGFLRLDLHELVLWRHVLQRLAPGGRYGRIEVPLDRPLLFEAAQAGGRVARPEVVQRAVTTTSRQFGSGRPSTSSGFRARNRVMRLFNRGRRMATRLLAPSMIRRRTILHARLDSLIAGDLDVLAVVRGQSFHVIQGAEGEIRADPYVSPVLSVLEAGGGRAAIANIGLNHENADDWAVLAADERSLPLTLLTGQYAAVRERLSRPEDLRRRLMGVQRVRLDVAGGDLGPALAEILDRLGGWFARQQRDRLIAERMISLLRPRVVLTGWEASRTAWLAAARMHGIPSVAIQHGVIYRNNPDYYRPDSPALVRPDLTCVFGTFERDLLTGECAYPADEVIATGSPRIMLDDASVTAAASAEERAALRTELGVAEGDRVLVISGARHTIGEELHSVTIFGRLLDGPLPGVHLVFKLHPEEAHGDHYLALVSGLAAAGGFEAPPITIVRDVDLYRLLRGADAHLGIYSTVLTDAVLTGTPNMVAVGQAWADVVGYVEAGVATPVRSVDDVRAFMRRPKAPTAAARARFLHQHYEPGDAAVRIAEAVARLAAGARPLPPARVPKIWPGSTAGIARRMVRRAVGRRSGGSAQARHPGDVSPTSSR